MSMSLLREKAERYKELSMMVSESVKAFEKPAVSTDFSHILSRLEKSTHEPFKPQEKKPNFETSSAENLTSQPTSGNVRISRLSDKEAEQIFDNR